MPNIQMSLSYQIIISYMWYLLKKIPFSNSQVITIIIIKMRKLKLDYRSITITVSIKWEKQKTYILQ